MQLWCIINESSGEAKVINRSSTTARPLTVCTYPEVCFHLVASDEKYYVNPDYKCSFIPAFISFGNLRFSC